MNELAGRFFTFTSTPLELVLVALLTFADAYAMNEGMSHAAIEKGLQASASQSRSNDFDIFLSHSIHDSEAIGGIYRHLSRLGLRVYVDWLEDPQMDRAQVSAQTAAVLRDRMNHSKALIYVASLAAHSSKWMPWELGYFDGIRADRVAVLPLAKAQVGSYRGLEYLGLYPYFEVAGSILAIRLATGNLISVEEFMNDGAYLVA